ncbi:MAG: YbjN domain-containing protein [Alphaproteobacteria bacterium]|nr:YbjN domain-containing protein [Alphaproteobacteria bacterium]
MKRVLISAAALAALLAPPAAALVTSVPLPAEGIAPAEMANLLAQHETAPKLAQSADSRPAINARTAGVGFDVSFGQCHGDRCRDVIFDAGWGNVKADANVTADKINRWNAENQFLRAYIANNTLRAEMDTRVARGSTANVEEYIELWKQQLRRFKSFMGL